MAQGDVITTIVGNMVDAPELRFTPSGAAVAKFTVASTPRLLDKASGEWRDGTPLFMPCTLWREAAEHAAESLEKGCRVVITGRLRQENWEDKNGGGKRSRLTMEVDEIGPSLRYATAEVTKAAKTGGGFGSSAQPTAQRGADPDPWSTGGTDRKPAGSFEEEVPF